MIDALNANSVAVTALATVALLLVTAFYALVTYQLLVETKRTRLSANQPRVVAYLRVNEVHPNIVQLHISNLSAAGATNVSVTVNKSTEWPERFDLENSKVLRDLSFIRPHELLVFDLGMGPELFRDEIPAEFEICIKFSGVDNRPYVFEETLRVESVNGFSRWQIYGIDDVARRLKDISETLKAVSAFQRIRVETYDFTDRKAERDAREHSRHGHEQDTSA